MMERRILTISSQTLAMKAKRVLSRASIPVKIVRPSPRLTLRGCTFGLETEAYLISRMMNILEEHRIPFGEILDI